ncbi:hypothetical protein KC351_g34 [Hortaea werneckii]|nr:hypothetical protein KC351_g34 [Hortaea werneckii]
MSVPRQRVLDLMKVQSRIFSTIFNPAAQRLGNKVLRQRLRGPSLAAYYPRRVATFKDLRALYPNHELYDEDEEDRLEHIQIAKSRGKGAPKKKKTAAVLTISSYRKQEEAWQEEIDPQHYFWRLWEHVRLLHAGGWHASVPMMHWAALLVLGRYLERIAILASVMRRATDVRSVVSLHTTRLNGDVILHIQTHPKAMTFTRLHKALACRDGPMTHLQPAILRVYRPSMLALSNSRRIGATHTRIQLARKILVLPNTAFALSNDIRLDAVEDGIPVRNTDDQIR